MFRSQPLRNEGFFLFVGLLAGARVGMGGGRGEGGITQRGKDKEDGELERTVEFSLHAPSPHLH